MFCTGWMFLPFLNSLCGPFEIFNIFNFMLQPYNFSSGTTRGLLTLPDSFMSLKKLEHRQKASRFGGLATFFRVFHHFWIVPWFRTVWWLTVQAVPRPVLSHLWLASCCPFLVTDHVPSQLSYIFTQCLYSLEVYNNLLIFPLTSS